MIDKIVNLINAYWKFDNDQQHLSTWHDKQDLIEAVLEVEDNEVRELLIEFKEWESKNDICYDDTTPELVINRYLEERSSFLLKQAARKK